MPEELNLGKDPIAEFHTWYKKAASEIMHDAMYLALANEKARPSVRTVLYKGWTDNGLSFFTNLNSKKAKILATNSWAELLFYWPGLARQVRISGRVERLNREVSEKYFQARPRESQIGAWASPQSESIANRQVLLDRVSQIQQEFAGKQVSCPPFWGGYQLIPEHFEFWESRADRLHERFCYTLENGQWNMERLAP